MTNPPATDQHNMRLLAQCDQGGRPDGVQLMVHRGFGYVGHIFSRGFSIIDLRDPRNPQAVAYIPAPPNTWRLHLQTHDAGLAVMEYLG